MITLISIAFIKFEVNWFNLGGELFENKTRFYEDEKR